MSKKYYVVIKGRTKGIFNNWAETEKSVSGYSGAIFKSFTTLEESKKYMSSYGIDDLNIINNEKDNIIINDNILKIYTDGSYSNGKAGIGIIFVKNDKILDQLGFKISESPTTNMRAELYAILTSIILSIDRQYKESIEINTDSEYCVNIFNNWIKIWCKNGWKTAKDKDIENLDLILEIEKLLDKLKNFGNIVKLKWVKAHSDNTYNNIADHFANVARKND